MPLQECLEDQEFSDWYNSRPAAIQEMIEATPPDQLYEMKNAGAAKTVYQLVSYEEDGTVTANRVAEHSDIPLEYGVFGINPDDLVVADIGE